MLIGTKNGVLFIAPDTDVVTASLKSVPTGGLRVELSTKTDIVEDTYNTINLIKLVDHKNLGIFGTKSSRDLCIENIFDLDGKPYTSVDDFITKCSKFFQ